MKHLLEALQRAPTGHLWLLSGLALAIAPHLTDLPLLISLPSLGLLGCRLLFELRLGPLPPRLLRGLLTAAALGIVFLSFQSLFGREAGIALLVVMLSLKLMEMNSKRDMIVVIGLGYFIVVTVFMFNQSIFIGLYMLVVVTLLTTALTALSRQASAVANGHNLKLAAIMLVQAAPIAVLLFVLFPRIPGPLWNLPSDSLRASTGLSDSMSPGNISQLSDNDSVAFRVQFDSPLPPSDQLYWRGPVFFQYDGKTWNNPDTAPLHSKRGSAQSISIGARLSRQPSYQASGQPISYQLTLEPHQRHWLFALDLPGKLPPQSWLTGDYEIISRDPVTQVLNYPMVSYPNYSLEAQQIPNVRRYLQLPENGGPRARQLAEKFSQQSTSPQEIVQLALQYIREQAFYYTRQPPLLLNDPVDQFLFDSQRGYCEHYASVFVFLMRAAGIPARVVTGYQGGEVNPLGDYFIVRQSDAHAWTEVWLQESGWLRIDPTAVIPASRIENSSDLARIVPDFALNAPLPGWTTRLWRQAGYGWDNLNHYWNQWIVNYNQTTQKDFLKLLGLHDIDWRGMVSLLITGTALVLAFVAFRILRLRSTKQDPILRAYARFCGKLARRGVVREPAEGPQAFALRASRQLPELALAINAITSLYLRLRYARHPTTVALQQMKSAVQQFRT